MRRIWRRLVSGCGSLSRPTAIMADAVQPTSPFEFRACGRQSGNCGLQSVLQMIAGRVSIRKTLFPGAVTRVVSRCDAMRHDLSEVCYDFHDGYEHDCEQDPRASHAAWSRLGVFCQALKRSRRPRGNRSGTQPSGQGRWHSSSGPWPLRLAENPPRTRSALAESGRRGGGRCIAGRPPSSDFASTRRQRVWAFIPGAGKDGVFDRR